MNIPNQRIINFLLVAFIFVWCIGILWEVVIYLYPSTFYLLPILKYNYSIVCHTESEKLFAIGNLNTLLCSRCVGIYFGGFLSSTIILIGLIKKISTKLLLLSSIPMFLDVILYSLGFYSYSKYLALFTGFLLGSVGFIYIHNAIIELLTELKGKN